MTSMKFALAVCLAACAVSSCSGQFNMLDIFSKAANAAGDALQQGVQVMQKTAEQAMAMATTMGQQAASGAMPFEEFMKKGKDIMDGLNVEQWTQQMMDIMKEGTQAAQAAVSEPYKKGMEVFQGLMSQGMPKEQMMQMMMQQMANKGK